MPSKFYYKYTIEKHTPLYLWIELWARNIDCRQQFDEFTFIFHFGNYQTFASFEDKCNIRYWNGRHMQRMSLLYWLYEKVITFCSKATNNEIEMVILRKLNQQKTHLMQIPASPKLRFLTFQYINIPLLTLRHRSHFNPPKQWTLTKL